MSSFLASRSHLVSTEIDGQLGDIGESAACLVKLLEPMGDLPKLCGKLLARQRHVQGDDHRVGIWMASSADRRRRKAPVNLAGKGSRRLFGRGAEQRRFAGAGRSEQ